MTLKEYNERLSIWMARATAHLDTPEIRAQAKAKFEEKMGKAPVEDFDPVEEKIPGTKDSVCNDCFDNGGHTVPCKHIEVLNGVQDGGTQAISGWNDDGVQEWEEDFIDFVETEISTADGNCSDDEERNIRCKSFIKALLQEEYKKGKIDGLNEGRQVLDIFIGQVKVALGNIEKTLGISLESEE